MPELAVLRVFCAGDGSGGNTLGVVRDGPAVAPADRQATAAAVGFSETVFIDDAEHGEIRIFTPAAELPFAGHPVVGTAWFLAGPSVLRPPAGEVPVRVEDAAAFAAGRPEWCPAFEWVELGSPAAVDALPAPPVEIGMAAYWAWIDEAAGTVRARVFPVDVGIEEDEATGSAALLLAAQLGRALEIRQGRTSVIHARPLDRGMVEIGGVVASDGVRPAPVPCP